MSEVPYYSPAWTKAEAEAQFYKRMLFMFDGHGFPCWHGPDIKTGYDAWQAEANFRRQNP